MASRVGSTITDRLRADVLGGALPPGTRLVELQLAEQYAASRAAVRNAIGELAKEGLVDRQVNRGATVRRVAIDEAMQIVEVRCLLEGLIAARAAAVATDEQRQELQTIIEQMRQSVAADQLARYSQLNGVLHRRLAQISGHTVAADMVTILRNRALHHDFRLALVPGRADQSLGQHEAIVAAVVAHDPDAAEHAMRAHLESVLEVLRRWIHA